MNVRTRLLVVVVLALVISGAASAELPLGLTSGLTLTHDSELRSYDVLRPAGSAGIGPVPLVVDLHGATSDGAQQRGISDWQFIAQTDGFVVAWPYGIDNVWNAGTCCGSAVSNDVDDVGFIRAMVAAVQAEADIDPGRIYVTGLSNGGAMSHRLACEAADLFAAAAPMAFPLPYVDFADCEPSEPIPLLTFMGLTDVLVPYSGAAPTFAAWRDEQGCDSAGAPPEIDETFGSSDCAIDTSCGAAALEVGLCSVLGSAFDPPLDVFDGHLLYLNDDAFNISQRAWDFMRRYGAPPENEVPLLSAPLLLGGALAAAGAAALARRRLR